MPIYSLEKTTDAILEKFNTRSEFEERKIVFWYDRDKTAGEDDLEYIKASLEKNGIKTLILENNFFETKKILEHDDIKSSYLIYSPDAEREYKKNWLLDIQLYSERFENSRISDLKSEIGIEGYDLDSFLEKHQKFFANKRRVVAFKKFHQNNWKEEEFIKGIFAVITGSSVVDQREIVKNLLMNSLNEEKNTIWENITRYELAENFWDMAGRQFGYYSEYPSLKKLFLSFIVSHIDRNTGMGLKSFEQYINKKWQSNECEIFISGWMENSNDSKHFDEYCSQLLVEDDKQLEKGLTSILNKSDVEDYINAESLDIFDKNIIRTIVGNLTEGSREYERYLRWIKKRQTKHWYPEFQNIYSALEYAIKLIRFSGEIEQKGIGEGSLNELFNEYSNTYYLHDLYYRKFYYHYDRDREKDILKNNIREIVEREYRRINEKILIKWSDLIESESTNKWKIELIDKQRDFFNNNVKKIISRNDRDKVAVIISDALRYEVAAELKDVLNISTNGTIEISAMAGSLPSNTRLGMASLLPHKEIEYRNDHIFVDGVDSDGILNREKVLQNNNPESVAINFKDLQNLKTDDARELLKGKRIVYVYHNRIDETGDQQSSQHEVFDAAESTIRDINDMINRLSRSLNVNNIVITADHGFIYNRDALEDADMVEMNGFVKDSIIIANKRFILSSEDTNVPNTHKFEMDSFTNSEQRLYLYVPYADLRFRLQGGGRNFVHGGVSLQEIVIPLLVYNHNRSVSDLDRKGIEHGTVKITPLELHKVIASNPFKIKLLQTENVTDKREPLRCRIAVWDNKGKRVSDEKIVIADKTSDEPNERIQEVLLTLGSDVKNGIYILRAVNDDTKALYRDVFEIPVEVDILITDDF